MESSGRLSYRGYHISHPTTLTPSEVFQTPRHWGSKRCSHSGFVSQETAQAAMAAPASSYLDDLQILMRRCQDWQSTDVTRMSLPVDLGCDEIVGCIWLHETKAAKGEMSRPVTMKG
ncbi:Transcription elongation factor SPT5 [Fusarium oxysporum f. sp. albedinis]|nr:Transcription elongation factor SPT5 [Fusarium oxysporum f. sp. albedinis]